MALLNSGNGYVPLNTEWPNDRLKFIISICHMQACIVETVFLENFISVLNELKFQYEKHSLENNYVFVKIKVPIKKYPKNLAYLLFTSGSTGFPKGIVHTSESVTTFLKWSKSQFDKYKVSKFVSIAPLNFDLSVFDVFYPLLNQKQLFVPNASVLSNPRLFIQFLVKHKIEVIYTTPSYLSLLLKTAQLHKYNLSFVKLVLVAGEQLYYSVVGDLIKHFKKAIFYNLYGPTETNVCTYYKISSVKRSELIVPIGKVCKGSVVKTDKHGELHYKGKLTMNAFIDEKGMHTVKKGSYYKTGDLVNKLKDGNYVFVGRKDNLVKRNGFRIELNEIKQTLLKNQEVSGCEVISLKENNGIIAFIESGADKSELHYKSLCLQKLPAYMVPDRIIVIPKLPLTANYKIDFKKLQQNYL